MERTTIFNRCSIVATTALAAVLAFGAVSDASARGYKEQGAQQQSGAEMPQTQSQSSQSGESQSVGLGIQTEQDVRDVQQKLIQQGYDAGQADGKWGEKTSSAVREFQQDHGLQPSGQIDQDTLDALEMAETETEPSSEPIQPDS